jgi:hypothetical protein
MMSDTIETPRLLLRPYVDGGDSYMFHSTRMVWIARDRD